MPGIRTPRGCGQASRCLIPVTNLLGSSPHPSPAPPRAHFRAGCWPELSALPRSAALRPSRHDRVLGGPRRPPSALQHRPPSLRDLSAPSPSRGPTGASSGRYLPRPLHRLMQRHSRDAQHPSVTGADCRIWPCPRQDD